MRKIKKYFTAVLPAAMCMAFLVSAMAQDSTATKQVSEQKEKTPLKPVKNTFDGTFIIDNQTCMVSQKKTLEFDIQHRFGTINNGKKDAFGLFAPANIRLGMIYTPVNNLSLGIGLTKEKMTWDGNAKLAIMRQSQKGGWPVSITYFANVAIDGREKQGNFVSDIDRYSYFNQLIIARKVTEKLSVQVAGSISHFNNVPGILLNLPDSTVTSTMKNNHCAVAFLGRYKITEKTAVIVNYDQPLTQHPMNNPHPNISFGIEMATSGHTFQIFMGNFQSIVQQYNNMFNQNDYSASRYVIGFNITRRWHL